MKFLKSTIRLTVYIVVVFYMSMTVSYAEVVGDKTGYLQALDHKALETQIHNRLIKKIKIENVQPFSEDETHWHHARWRCTKGAKHSHIGSRRHTHKFKCSDGKRSLNIGASETAPYASQQYGSQQQVEGAAPVVSEPVMAPKAAPKPQASKTNLQEEGVDEADFVKTDGYYIYAISNQDNLNTSSGIRIFDTTTSSIQPKQIGVIGFEKGLQLSGMYLVPNKNKLIAVGRSYRNKLRKTRSNYWSSVSSIITIDIKNKTKPRVIQHVKFEGYSRSSRRIGDKLYMVISNHGLSYPSTYKYVETPTPMTKAQNTKVRNQIINTIKRWSITDAMPHYRVLGKSKLKVLNKNNSKIMKAHGDSNQNSLTTLLTINLSAKNFTFDTLHYFGYIGTLYASTKALYVTQSSYRLDKNLNLDKTRFPIQFSKQLIHKFAYNNKRVDYRGSGAVFGSFGWSRNSSFQLDEDNKGNLRVVSQNWNSNSTKYKDPVTKSPVIVTALAEHPHYKQLITLSRLPNLKHPKALGKKGERLYASRLFNDYAYFVTFRRTDPLYVVDLRNPRDMIVRGELEIPGFSDYLHPINSTLLMGIGKEADNEGRVEGLKLSLFDISNPRRPLQVDTIQLGSRGTHSPANQHHHAFTSLKMRQSSITRVSLPIHLVKKENKSYKGKDALHQFEVNSKTKKIKQVGKLAPPKTNKKYWYWNSTDRSIIIDNKVYYYQNGKIWAGIWGAN